jgi:signal transduction histidine kinase
LAFLADGQVLGFLNLKDERLREAYSSEEIRMLMGVAAQASLTIENSRMFDRLRDRDRLAALGEMSAGLAHEIRNPLGAIKGAAQLLEPVDGEEADPEMLKIIIEETNRLNTVVSQFLDYARPNRKASTTPTDINHVVERTIEVVRADNPGCSEVNMRLSKNLKSLETDPEQLKQVFLNLAQNALQAMGEGGTLTVSTRMTRGPALQSDSSTDNRQFVRIAFTDTGPGIPEDVRRNLFIPFYTTKDRGTGLGLALSLRIMKNLGGTIEVSSRLGQGTTFNVLVPVEP